MRKIQAEGDPRPMPPLDEARQKFTFQHSLYEDAVVMPWYRNQDQPQVRKVDNGFELFYMVVIFSAFALVSVYAKSLNNFPFSVLLCG